MAAPLRLVLAEDLTPLPVLRTSAPCKAIKKRPAAAGF